MAISKKNRMFLWWLLVVVVAIGLLGSNSLISLFTSKKNISTRDLAFTCTTDELTQFHIHPHLTILVNGNNIEIPANTGISLTCLHPLHTHDNTGTIHIESPETRDFILGDFFAVWGQPFSKNQILNYLVDASHTITMTVDGQPSQDFENLVLRDNQKIVIEYKQATSSPSTSP